MRIEKRETDLETLFILKGVLSGIENTALLLFDEVSAAIDCKPPAIRLDFAEITYIDSMTIGLLVGLLLKCKENGIAFSFDHVCRDVREVLDSTRLIRVFPTLYK